MKIEFMQNETTPFGDVKVGQTFQHGKSLYLKTAPKSWRPEEDEDNFNADNAVDLKSGFTVFFEDSVLVNDKGKFCIMEI